MTEAERRSHQIDRDRRVVEIAAMFALLPLLGTAAEHAAQAVRIGASPADAASVVLAGNADVHQPGITGVLARAGTAAWLLGYFRSHAVAQEMTRSEAVSMRTYRRAILGTLNMLQPPPAQADVIARMIAGAGGESVIRHQYNAVAALARPIVRNIETRVAARLNRITIGGPSADYTAPADGVHLPDSIARGMREARLAFERAGVGSSTSWYIDDRHPQNGEPNTSANAEAIVEAVVGQQYERGRYTGAVVASDLEDNDGGGPKRVLWGWTWSSYVDGRRCKYCRALHGCTAPLDDPMWEQFGPLLHFGCRCSRLERFARFGQEPPTIRRPDFSDGDVIEAIRMRRSLTRWWDGVTDPELI